MPIRDLVLSMSGYIKKLHKRNFIRASDVSLSALDRLHNLSRARIVRGTIKIRHDAGIELQVIGFDPALEITPYSGSARSASSSRGS
jgi:hypothetical protein